MGGEGPTASLRSFHPLRDYAVIGDQRSAALVSVDGSIDWLCFPRFDSPSLFAAILDPDRGGHLWVGPEGRPRGRQDYVVNTNVLRTRYGVPDGVLEVTDFMPAFYKREHVEAFHELHRRVLCRRGHAVAAMDFQPRFNYGAEPSRLEILPRGAVALQPLGPSVTLASQAPLHPTPGGATARVDLAHGEGVDFILRWGDRLPWEVDRYRSLAKLDATVESWRKWVGFIQYKGRWPGAVLRSALLLQLLTYDPTAAVVAAPTTSLPEVLGGVRNWDYRYNWSRDAAFFLLAMESLGYYYPFLRYTSWLLRQLRGVVSDIGHLRIMYTVEGEERVPEGTLDHLGGYMGSRPVRIGNAAQEQFQLDIYGIIMDAILRGARGTNALDDDEVWRFTQAIGDFVTANWRKPDRGIWEMRTEDRKFVHSDLMAWVALDRAVQLAEASGNGSYADDWRREREAVRGKLEEGFNPRLGSFVQYYGSDALDAALLSIPLFGFLPADDPRVVGTMDAIQAHLAEGPLVFRYRTEDGLPGREGAFFLTSFWLVDALALAGRVEAARKNFDALLGMANHVGLYSEEIDTRTGVFLGNFPQGYTHLALIYSASILDRALDAPPGDRPTEVRTSMAQAP